MVALLLKQAAVLLKVESESGWLDGIMLRECAVRKLTAWEMSGGSAVCCVLEVHHLIALLVVNRACPLRVLTAHRQSAVGRYAP